MAEPRLDVLIKWLADVKEAEHRLYVVDNAIESGAAAIRRLEEPISVQDKQPEHFEPNLNEQGDGGVAIMGLTATYIIGYVVWVIICFVSEGILWGIGGGFLLGFIWPLLVLVGGLSIGPDNWDYTFYLPAAILAIGFLGSIAAEGFSSHSIEKRNRAEKERVEKLNQESIREADETNSRRKKEASCKMKMQRLQVPIVQKEMIELQSTRQCLARRRDQLYEAGFLHPSYQGLAPVTTMLGYLETGRCTALYGHGGAIDTLVHDSQFELIVGKLDTIISRLDGIGSSLGFLAVEMRSCREEVSALNRGINSIKNDLDRIDLSTISDEMLNILESNRTQEGDLKRIKECEEYRAQCQAYLNGQRQYLPPRLR